LTTDPFAFPPVGRLLDRLGIRLSKHKSQHFLKDQGVCRRIATYCNLTSAHSVLEIGTGLGNLSCELARVAGHVVSVEMDESFRTWHSTLTGYHPNLRVHCGDFLKADEEALLAGLPPGPRVAAGNLPYQITAPILFRLVESPTPWESIVIMVQLEVAERITAGVPSRDASALTYKLALLFDSEILFRLPPGAFLPPPKVHSAVVRLRPRAQPVIGSSAEKAAAFRLLSGIFTHRRRTLANAMHLAQLVPERSVAEAALHAAGIDPVRRPETLTLEESLALSRTLGATS